MKTSAWKYSLSFVLLLSLWQPTESFALLEEEEYEEPSAQSIEALDERWTNYEEMVEELFRIEEMSEGLLELDVIGESHQGRDIYATRMGDGDQVLLIDSEIHGNEKSGTEAIIDMLDELAAGERDHILEEVTIVTVPKLNPDGSELVKRQNDISWEEVLEYHPHLEGAEPAWYHNESRNGFDINRDFHPDLDFEAEADDLPGTSAHYGFYLTNEARALANLYQELQEEFGIVESYVNLHHMGTPQLEGTDQDVSIALSHPPLGPDNNPKYAEDYPEWDQDKSRRYNLAAAEGIHAHAEDGHEAGLARYTYPSTFDLSGIALGAFGLNGSGAVLFEMAGQQPQVPYDQELIDKVTAGLWGIAESMTDGSVHELDGDAFYDIPKYWPDTPPVSDPEQHVFDFTDEVVGEQPDEWSPIWQGEDEQLTIADEPLRLEHTARSGVRGFTADAVGELYGSTEIFALVQGSNIQNHVFELGFHMSGSPGSENGIYADARLPDDEYENGTVRIMQRSGGSSTTLGIAEPGFEVSEDEWYRVLLQRDAAALQLKVWPDGEDEPDSWQIVTTEDNMYGGQVGFSHSTPGAVNDLAYIGVGVGGKRAPHADDDHLGEPVDPPEEGLIRNLQPAENRTLAAGESVRIAFDSDPGLNAVFSIRLPLTSQSQPPTELPMWESSPGQYVGYWTAIRNLSVQGAEIEVKVTDADGNETRETAEGRLNIN
ncbi:M14 family zinc carboxypeptidase [Geomicrobium sp. JSM 1781026]|uniref:M14 family zinc carboxypeptidase n=1 Tax=Geomicrobium sp. JSM 1781026 TaxID=3344580 RepID=UPI0035BEF2D4